MSHAAGSVGFGAGRSVTGIRPRHRLVIRPYRRLSRRGIVTVRCAPLRLGGRAGPGAEGGVRAAADQPGELVVDGADGHAHDLS